MGRVTLTDGSGKWFDTDAAVKFEEDTWWNGNNHISKATGSQWDHEWLWYSKSGRWILNSFSNYQGVAETYEEIEEDDAVRWLISQEKFEDDNFKELPETVRKAVENSIEAAEI